MAYSAVRLFFITVGIPSMCLFKPSELGPIKAAVQDLMKLNLQAFMDQISVIFEDVTLYNATPSMYQLEYESAFAIGGLKPKHASLSSGCNILLTNEEMHVVIELTVNGTLERGIAQMDEYKNKFLHDDRDVLCLAVDYQFYGTARPSMQDRLVCVWAANLYHENGTLKKTFPRNEDVFMKQSSEAVNPKRTPIKVYYDIEEPIGKGDRSIVHVCREKKTGNRFAAKFKHITWPAHLTKEKILEEIDIMQFLHHPNLLRLYDVFEEEEAIILIVDLLTGGNLFNRQNSIGNNISEAQVVDVIRQIGEGIRYLHEHNIVHFDIHPGNIMCQTPPPCTEVKLIDFSKAGRLDTITVDFEKGYLPKHKNADPQFLEGKRIGFFTDMWSLGLVAYYLISGNYPFSTKHDTEMPKNIDMSQLFKEISFRGISEEGKDFIRRLLVEDRKRRMTIHESLNHAWLTK